MPKLDDLVAHWFEKRRGIRRETVEAFGVYTEGRDLVIPYPEGLLKRRYSEDPENRFGLEKEGRRFVWRDADGGPTSAGQVPFLPPDFEQRERMLLLEGETDTMAAWQALRDAGLSDKVSVVGISGVGSWKERYAEELFAAAKRVFVPLDNDDPYTDPKAVESVERGWQLVRASLGKKARRVKLPQGIEDVAAFFVAYDWPAFEVLLKAAAQPRRHYPRIDFTKPAPPTDWLVEGLLVMGETTVFAGDSGLGKSMILQYLAKQIAAKEAAFLGRAIKHHGPVLYVDEENSEAIIRQRLKAMGLQLEHHEWLEYINYGGVNLFTEPELLLEEALDIEPVAIFIDSQSATALGAEENSNDDMTRLYTRSIKPLARETGASVVIVHHVLNDGQRARGAGAIRAQADQVLSAIRAEDGAGLTGRINIFASKERRQTDMIQAQIVGSIEHDGWVKVEAPGEDAF